MAHNHAHGVPSTAAIAGHPLHPAFVPFPIAFLVGALFTDLGYWWTADPFWARVSLWLIGAGLVMGALAAALGLIDFLTIQRAREYTAGWVHFLGNAAMLIMALINLLWRLGNPASTVLPWGLTFSAVTTLMLAVTGWLGGELSYRYLIGVTGYGAEDSQQHPYGSQVEPHAR